jgi:hypothetical protein
MNKMIYEAPKLEVIALDISDVIATSGEETGGEEPP